MILNTFLPFNRNARECLKRSFFKKANYINNVDLTASDLVKTISNIVHSNHILKISFFNTKKLNFLFFS